MKVRELKKGFTLIELLVVVAIIGVLSALLMANFVGIRQRARDGQRKSDLRQIQSAFELYRADTGQYPTLPSTCGNAAGATIVSGSVTYMKKVPCDPLTNAVYQYAGSISNYCLRTCLENTNDPQKTTGSGSCSSLLDTVCTNSGYVSYTVENP